MDNKEFKDIVLYELRELRKDVKQLEQWKAKVYGGVIVLVTLFEIAKHKFFK